MSPLSILAAAARPTLETLLAACPPAVFSAAALPGGWQRLLRPAPPTPEELGALLADFPAPALRALVHAIATRTVRNRLLELLVDRRGVGALAPYVRTYGFETLRARRAQGLPALLVTWHVGPYPAVGAGLLASGLAFLALRRHVRGPECAGMQTAPTGGGAWEATVALKQAITRLRQGGLVLMAGDGLQGEGGAEVELLGRRVVFQRGLAVLAHHGRTPVFPVVARWRGHHVEVHLHEPLAATTSHQDDLLHATARWFDAHLRSAPEELRPDRIRLLLSAPRVDALKVCA